MKIAVGVPVMYNFPGYAKLMYSLQGENITHYIQNNWDQNIGVAGAWNIFLEQSLMDEIDLLFIINDDVVFHEGTFSAAIEAWKNKPKDCILMCANVNIKMSNDFQKDIGDMCCFAVNPKEIVEEIGYFDSDNFFPAYFEDDDFAYRIRLSKFKYYIHGAFKVSHEGSRTQFWNGEENRVVSHNQFRENENRYILKWGGLPGKEKFTRPFDGV